TYSLYCCVHRHFIYGVELWEISEEISFRRIRICVYEKYTESLSGNHSWLGVIFGLHGTSNDKCFVGTHLSVRRFSKCSKLGMDCRADCSHYYTEHFWR